MSSYNDASCQYEQNMEVARRETFTAGRALQKTKDASMPVVLWDDKYYNNPKEFINQLRRISDYMLFNPHPLWAFDNPNQAYLFEVVAGKLRMDDYYTADHLFGEQGPVPTKDNHFFHGAKSALNGQVLAHPFQFTVKNLSTEFAKHQIREDSKMGAKVLTQMLAEAAGGQSMNLDFAKKKGVKLPKDENDLLNYMTSQEQIESIVYKLLRHTDYQYPFQDVGSKCFDDKFAVNAQFGFLDVENGVLVPRHYHPDQVRWMATRRVENFEDKNVLAASVMDYMTPTELLNKFGLGLQTGTGIKGIVDYIDSVTKWGRRVGYELDGNYWNDQGIGGWGLGSNLNNLDIQGYTHKQINWMNRAFYPVLRGASGLLMQVLVQRNFVKVVKQKRFKVERVEDGAARPATDKEIKQWRETNFDRSVQLNFTAVDEKAKENLSRQNVKVYNRTELWGFDRIGHDSFTNVGPYQFQADPDRESTGYVGMPIKAQISYEKSMAKLGENDAIRVNILYRAVDEYLINMGISEAIIIDDAQEGLPLEYLYNIKKSGVAKLNSTMMQPSNQAQLRHLQTIKLSNHTDELQVAFNLIRDITTSYETRVGLSPQVQGVSDRYEGLRETQLNIQNQQLLLTKYLHEHNLFMNQLLQGAADIVKNLYAYDGIINIILSDGERELLRLTRKLSLADMDVHLESGQVIENRLKLIQGILQAMAASGGAKEGGALLEASMTRSPAEAQAIYKRLTEQMDKAAQAAAQAQSQQAQLNAQLKMKEMEIEIQKEQMQTDRAVLVQKLKNEEKRQQADDKGELSDIGETNDRQKMVLGAQLEQKQIAAEQQDKKQLQSAS